MSHLASAVAAGLTGLTRILTGAQARWLGCAPVPRQRIYYANHNSHVDMLLIQAALPPALRAGARPVAGADYWLRTRLRRFLVKDVLRAVLIDRTGELGLPDPVTTMSAALEQGDSLILFPEGTRNTTEERLMSFRSGLYHLACAHPAVDLIPVWIDNVVRVLPKGEAIPLPLLCSVTFGAALRLAPDEDKAPFLARARQALLDLATTASPA